MKARIDDIELTETAEMLYNFRDGMTIEGIKSILWQQANHQSKVSFEAGIKEVVKWLGQHYVVRPDKDSITQFAPYYMISIPDVESKLKEWGCL